MSSPVSDVRSDRPAAPPPEAESTDEGAVTVLEWLSLYVPSWGTSVLLHAALILLAAFVVWQPMAEARHAPPTASPLLRRPPDIERRPGPPVESDNDPSRKPLTEKPYVFAKPSPAPPKPGLGELDEALFIPVLGIEGGPAGSGNPFPDGGGRDLEGPQIFADPGVSRIVYVVDKSGSMTDSFDIVKLELKRSLRELSPDCEFHIIFYSSGPALEMPTRRLVPATETNVRLAEEFIDGVIAASQTDPSGALERAFAVRPARIYLLTDGEFDRAIVDLVGRLNVRGRVRVDTIAFLYRTGEPILKEIAARNGGRYKFVSERDVAVLGG